MSTVDTAGGANESAWSGSLTFTQAPTYTYWPQWWMQPVYAPPKCNHCWCERHATKVDHARCCKCGDAMHDQFLGENIEKVVVRAVKRARTRGVSV